MIGDLVLPNLPRAALGVDIFFSVAGTISSRHLTEVKYAGINYCFRSALMEPPRRTNFANTWEYGHQ